MIAYFDCYSGVSGDMVLGALVDAGVPIEDLRRNLSLLDLEGYAIESHPTGRGEFKGSRVSVLLDDAVAQPHRHLRDILALIQRSRLSPWVRDASSRIFQRLAEAEATVHGMDLDDVHFHEVGAVDAIVDVVGAAIGLEILGVRKVYSSPLPTGYGTVACAHGVIPVPGPATLELLRRANAPSKPGGVEAELVTPTGAAIVTTLAEFSSPRMNVTSVGYGFGQKELPWPNALRLWLGTPLAEEAEEDSVVVVETNLDDMSPELLGAAMSTLLEAGALDVFFTPIQMKKNRPGVMLTVLAPPGLEASLCALVLRHTTSLGVRCHNASRVKAARRQETVETPWGPVRVKVKTFGGETTTSPEYDDCVRIAKEHGVSLAKVYAAVGAVSFDADRGVSRRPKRTGSAYQDPRLADG